MFTAMIDAVAEKGYVKTTVGDVLRGAGVSRATFYEQFTDKADCFSATYTWVVDLLGQLVDVELAASTSPEDPLATIDTLVGFYLDLLTQAPSLAKVFLVEVYAAGPVVIELRKRTVDAFVDQICTTLVPQLTNDADAHFTVRILVTSLVAMVTEAVAIGDVAHLGELRAPFRAVVERLLNGH